ncbi:MAG: glycosyltransferase [Halobacteriota archaeon]
MSRILFGSPPSSGHYNPLIAIAKKLLARGHAVRFASHPALRPTFEKAEIPFLSLGLACAAPPRYLLRSLIAFELH